MVHRVTRTQPDLKISGSTGLLPVVGENPVLLILGSFPSSLSLTHKEYYGNPQNQFWRIMDDLFSIPVTLQYGERVEQIRKHHIALWDVVNSCTRPGSSDAKIENPVFNDIPGFLTKHPTIRIIACNGTTARKYFDKLKANPGYGVHTLPSTSPANAAIALHEKIVRWRAVLIQREEKETFVNSR